MCHPRGAWYYSVYLGRTNPLINQIFGRPGVLLFYVSPVVCRPVLAG